MDLREEVRGFIRSLLSRREENPEFSDRDSLVISGRVSSVEVIDIAVFLEKRFGIDFSQRPFDQYDFDSIEKIVGLLKKTDDYDEPP